MKTLLLSKDDVENSLCMKDVIESVKKGYLAYNAGKVDQPDIVSMEIPEYNGETDIKSCCDKEGCTMSVKIASGFYDNGKENSLPSMIGMILLFDAKTGFQLCVMDGSLITGAGQARPERSRANFSPARIQRPSPSSAREGRRACRSTRSANSWI